MRVFGPIMRILGIPVVLRLLFILAVVEAIFLAESFTTLLEEALRHGGVALDVTVLLLFKTPEIFDLALALGMLIAVYFVVADARNRGELLILASTGIRWSRIIGVILILGMLGGFLSLAFAGFLSPMARYAGRLKMAELRSEHIIKRIEHGGPVSSQQTIRDVTFIATPPKDSNDRRGQLFVLQPNLDGTWRAVQSRNWQVTDPDSKKGQRKIQLQDLSAYEGVFPTQEKPLKHVSTFSVDEADFAFRMSDVVKPPARGRSKAERLLNISPTQTPRLARLATRALMVPMAALLALAAIVAGGAGLGRFAALPIAALILMTGDVLARSVVAGYVESVSPPLLFLLALSVYLGPPLAYLIHRGEALMIPGARGS